MADHSAAPNARTAPLRVHLLGGFRVVADGRTLDGASWRARQAAAVVKLLALAPGHRLQREQLCEALWPEHDPESAGANLRQVLRGARRALEPERPAGAPAEYLRQEGEALALAAPGVAWVDVAAFEEGAALARRSRDPGDYRAALALYAGDLLPDDRYEEWATERRESLRTTRLALLLDLARAEEEEGRLAEAMEALRAVVAAEPAHEDAHAGLMRLYARQGQPAQAQRQYAALREALRREVDAEPSAASRALAEAIRAGRISADAPATPVTPAADKAAAPRHNLPTALTSFVGREHEVLEVRELLATHRLVTLVGAGGAGKTRLALETAGGLVESFADGVWLAELAALADPAAVPGAVAGAVGVREEPGRPLAATLVDALRSRALLVALDNCEHLIDASARLAEEVLRGCPGVRLLATSREPLGVPGEVLYRVPSLALPDPAAPLDAIAATEATRLFVERAQTAQPRFALNERNAATVAEVCARLDGIPLALELAAARLRALPVDELARRLDDAFRLLTGGSRTALPRQQTLQATIDWSYRLLEQEERLLLHRLAVFVGDWTLDAAEAVCAGEGLEDGQILDLLARLVDKSLVVHEERADGTARYRLLETVRQYAAERLAETGEVNATRDRHAAHYLALTKEGDAPVQFGPRDVTVLAQLDAEYTNLRGAIGWFLERSDGPRAQLLAGRLWRYCWIRGHHAEARRWLVPALALDASPTPARALALYGAGTLDLLEGRPAEAATTLEASLDIYWEHRDEAWAATVLNLLATATAQLGDYALAEARFAEAGALYQALGDERGGASVLSNQAFAGALPRGEFARARDLLERAAAVQRRLGSKWDLANVLANLTNAALGAGDLARARAAAEEALALRRELGRSRGLASELAGLGWVLLAQGELGRAADLLAEGFAVALDFADTHCVADCLLGLAGVAEARGEAARAARLHGAAEAAYQRGAPRAYRALPFPAEPAELLAAARIRLATPELAATWDEGRALSREDLTAIARTIAGPPEGDTP